MHVMDSPGEGPDGRSRVDSLPEEMARIIICPNYRPNRVSEAQERFGVVYDEAGVHLEPQLDPMLFSEPSCLLPVRKHLAFPLPGKEFAVLSWPGACHPIGVPSRLRVTWTTGEEIDDADT